jgi:hypothetical protein
MVPMRVTRENDLDVLRPKSQLFDIRDNPGGHLARPTVEQNQAVRGCDDMGRDGRRPDIIDIPDHSKGLEGLAPLGAEHGPGFENPVVGLGRLRGNQMTAEAERRDKNH